ncbi:LytR/AlgR family response regulator transcription factor [Flavobacterium sp.]|uniref:LytR/AlgR family response regulator transcription factor n=1 Tax=Flavobacterium sp. TaxID=239 RepID=UPI003D0C7275
MKYKCLIIDDEPLARELIASHLSHFENFELVHSCENALVAYNFLELNQIDLIFLDIEMPLLKGNDFIKKLKNPPQIIFTTAYREYALEGYELNIIDYLLKPITFDRFFTAIEKYKQLQTPKNIVENTEIKYLFLSTANKKIKLIFEEIIFIESLKDYITIHLENGVSHHLKHNISSVETMLPKNFVRIHRSFLINYEKITAYSKNEIEINTIEIPIGSSYRENWLNFLALKIN